MKDKGVLAGRACIKNVNEEKMKVHIGRVSQKILIVWLSTFVSNGLFLESRFYL